MLIVSVLCPGVVKGWVPRGTGPRAGSPGALGRFPRFLGSPEPGSSVQSQKSNMSTNYLRNAKQVKAMQSNAKQVKAIQSNTKQCKAMESKAEQSNAKQCKVMQSNAKQCNAQSKAKQNNAKQCTVMQNNAKKCKATQSNAT